MSEDGRVHMENNPISNTGAKKQTRAEWLKGLKGLKVGSKVRGLRGSECEGNGTIEQSYGGLWCVNPGRIWFTKSGGRESGKVKRRLGMRIVPLPEAES